LLDADPKYVGLIDSPKLTKYELSSYENCARRLAAKGDVRAEPCRSGTSPHLPVDLSMSNDDKNLNTAAPSKVSIQPTGQSQDAVRHEKDALHHKFHKSPQPSREDEKNDQRSQARPQSDKDDLQPGEGQPETPKVGSRDAPGG
jgi:hypothetical protein